LIDDKDVSFELKAKHKVMGSALHITLPSKLKKESSITVKILYQTSKDCTALQWLEKECVVARVTETNLLKLV
jgi:leukotriene-A4 hydrolase